MGDCWAQAVASNRAQQTSRALILMLTPVKLCILNKQCGFSYSAFAVAQRESSPALQDRKSTRLNSSHQIISYAVFCLKKKKKKSQTLHMYAVSRDQYT